MIKRISGKPKCAGMLTWGDSLGQDWLVPCGIRDGLITVVQNYIRSNRIKDNLDSELIEEITTDCLDFLKNEL